MEKIYNVDDAKTWFLEHSSKVATVVNSDGKEKQCWTYKEAIEWLKY